MKKTKNKLKKTKAPKENNFNKLFQMMDAEEKKAELLYHQMVKEDQAKTLFEILPDDFKKVKRSIIKRSILERLTKTTDILNKSGIYDGRTFTEKEVARYMMIGEKYDNFYLSHFFVPKKDSTDLWWDFISEYREKLGKKTDLTDIERKTARAIYEEKNKDLIETYQNVRHALACLIQLWEQYEERQKVKKGQVINSYDIEDDGFPRTSRGNLCYLFVPVKGIFPKNKKGEFKLRNPRTRKNVSYQIESYKKEDEVYACINDKGKKVFLVAHEHVADAWDALFSSNKEIFAGWWNKIMVSKEK